MLKKIPDRVKPTKPRCRHHTPNSERMPIAMKFLLNDWTDIKSLHSLYNDDLLWWNKKILKKDFYWLKQTFL